MFKAQVGDNYIHKLLTSINSTSNRYKDGSIRLTVVNILCYEEMKQRGMQPIPLVDKTETYNKGSYQRLTEKVSQ